MPKPSFTTVKASAKCPSCGDLVAIQTQLTMFQLATSGRVKVHLAPVHVIHICPAVVPAQRRRRS